MYNRIRQMYIEAIVVLSAIYGVASDAKAAPMSDLEEVIEQSQKIAPKNKPKSNFIKDANLESYLLENRQKVYVNELPSQGNGVTLGMYVHRGSPSKDTTYILNGLSPEQERYVDMHEFVHYKRMYTGEPQDEYSVDLEATARLGYNPFSYFS